MLSSTNTSSSGSGRSSNSINGERNSIFTRQKFGGTPLYNLTLRSTSSPSFRETVNRSDSLATGRHSATGQQSTLYRFQVIKWSSHLLPICSNSTSTRGSREEHLVLQLLQWHLKPDTRYYTCQTALALFSIQAQSSFKLLFCIKHKIRIKSNRRSVKKTAVLCYVAPWSLV